MKSQNNSRNNRPDNSGTYERRNYRESGYQNSSKNRFPEDTESHSRKWSDREDENRNYNSYNSDSRRDADAYTYRSSGGYGRQDNYDRRGYYDVNSQAYNDRYNMNAPREWHEDRERRSSRDHSHDSYRNESQGYSNRNEDRYSRPYNEQTDYRNEGYNGRNASDYTSFYGDRHYDPSENYNRRDDRGYTYRHDEDYERENRRPEHPERYSWGREDADRSKGSYGYYESYPSYGQSESYGDHERYSGKTGANRGRTDKYGETDTEHNRQRPNVRDRRSW